MATSKLSAEVYRALQGVFCVYKPSNMSTHGVTRSLQLRICNDLNKLPLNRRQAEVVTQYELNSCGNLATYDQQRKSVNPPSHRLKRRNSPAEDIVTHSEVAAVPQDTEGNLSITDSNQTITELPKELSPLRMEAKDVQFHPSVLGGLWRNEDITLCALDNLNTLTTGLLPYAIGHSGREDLEVLRMYNPIKVYRVTAQLGVATSNFMVTGGILEKVEHRHVTQPKIDRLLSAIQASHQKQQFAMAGVDIQSQEAYELASRGLVRPEFHEDGSHCVLYSIKSVEWNPPQLLIEMHTVNETCPYIMKLIHDLGQDLRCGAVCTKIRRIRVGHFDLSHTLVASQWNCEEISKNIEECLEPLAHTMADRLDQLESLQDSKLIASSKIERDVAPET